MFPTGYHKLEKKNKGKQIKRGENNSYRSRKPGMLSRNTRVTKNQTEGTIFRGASTTRYESFRLKSDAPFLQGQGVVEKMYVINLDGRRKNSTKIAFERYLALDLANLCTSTFYLCL